MTSEQILKQFDRRIFLFSISTMYIGSALQITSIYRGGSTWPGYINLAGFLLTWWIYRRCRHSIINNEIRRRFQS